MDLRQMVKKYPVMAIMRNIPVEDTVSYANSIFQGGIHLFEVALNSKDGLSQIVLLKKQLDKRAVIGAGTAVTVELVKAAVDAGADFLLTPNTDENVLAYCAKNQIPLMPGVMTPSDVGICCNYGYELLKLFPAGELPAGYVKTLKGPFANTDYVAIGGVHYGNWKKFMQMGFSGVGLGSSLLPANLKETRDWNAVRDFVAQQFGNQLSE